MNHQQNHQRQLSHRTLWALLALTLVALGLRMLVFAWHRPYPLSGDEAAFFEQARTFVQGRGYHDLELMRGPLYPLFLAVIFRIFGAEVTAARLAQVLVSTATVPLLYLWARRRHGDTAGLVAAAMGTVFFAFGVQATFLLTETLFLFLFALGMVVLERGLERPAWWVPLASGAIFGLATLTRSIGLPLVVLAAAAFWVVGARRFPHPDPAAEQDRSPCPPIAAKRGTKTLRPCLAALLVLAGAALVVLPWTVRNTIVYRSFILVDTTGTTNLWLDNDPELGRDKVKAELLKYPEGERQSLSVRRGLRSITTHPRWFLGKCWREVQSFFSLEYFDDFLRRPAIWYPPGEVWSRVLLGDGLYLLLVATGLAGLAGSRTRMKLFDLLWLLYLPVSTALYHVELRYRLPFLIALAPYAAFALARPRETGAAMRRRPARAVLAALLFAAFAAVLLSRANYPKLSLQIVRKRVHVVLGRWALQRGDAQGAGDHARAGIAAYPESAEARALLAQALRARGDTAGAEAALRQAIAYRSGNPHPHLLLGDLLRAGRPEEAAEELAHEAGSLEDLQRWAWRSFSAPVPEALNLGSHLELGHILGWHLPERLGDGITFRWSDDRVRFCLGMPEGAGPGRLTLQLNAGRPPDLPLPSVELWLEGEQVGRFVAENGWHRYTVDVGDRPAGTVLWFELRSPTFRPHRYDPHLDDNRPLGVMVDWLELTR